MGKANYYYYGNGHGEELGVPEGIIAQLSDAWLLIFDWSTPRTIEWLQQSTRSLVPLP